MKQQLDQLNQRAMDLIKSPSITDPALIARLAPIPAKIQHLQRQWTEAENEATAMDTLLKGIEGTLDVSPESPESHSTLESLLHNGRRAQTKLRIQISSTFLGGPPKTICAHKGSDSLAEFLTLLYEIKGVQVLEALRKCRVNRAPLVSTDPKKDYRYWSGSREAEYKYQRIGNSGFYVFTNSTTQEKADAIQRAWAILRFPADALKVEVVSKNDY